MVKLSKIKLPIEQEERAKAAAIADNAGELKTTVKMQIATTARPMQMLRILRRRIFVDVEDEDVLLLLLFIKTEAKT